MTAAPRAVSSQLATAAASPMPSGQSALHDASLAPPTSLAPPVVRDTTVSTPSARPHPRDQEVEDEPVNSVPVDAGDNRCSRRRLAALRRAARRGLPTPSSVGASIAVALIEVERGYRPRFQLERLCDPGVWHKVKRQLVVHAGPANIASSIVQVHCQELAPGVADVVVIVRCHCWRAGDSLTKDRPGDPQPQAGKRSDSLQGEIRVTAVAMRLDASKGQWRVTELHWRSPQARTTALSPPLPD